MNKNWIFWPPCLKGHWAERAVPRGISIYIENHRHSNEIKSCHSYYSRNYWLEKPLWVCLKLMIIGLLLSPGGPTAANTGIWAASSHPRDWGWSCPQPAWCGLGNSLTRGSRLAGPCSPAKPVDPALIHRMKMPWAAQGQDEHNASLFIAVSSLSPGRCIKAFHACKATSIPSIWAPCPDPSQVFNWGQEVPSGAFSPLGNCASTWDSPKWSEMGSCCLGLWTAQQNSSSVQVETQYFERWREPLLSTSKAIFFLIFFNSHHVLQC